MSIKIFQRKQITYFGTEKDLIEYENRIGRASNLENNIMRFLNCFQEAYKGDEDFHSLICSVSNDYSMILLHSPTNKHDVYMMFYDRNSGTRIYSTDLDDIPKLYDKKWMDKFLEYIPRMCEFSKHSKDLWMIEDLQSFADAIDKYDLEYE